MKMTDLTEEEIALVQKNRAGAARAVARRAFQRNAIATAQKFDDWSESSGEGLTFSTFVNTFGYQEANGRQMYEAVERILAAALPR